MTVFDASYVVIAVLAVAAAIYSLTAATKGSPTTKKVLLVLWLIVPPVFFFLEYWIRHDQLAAIGDLERVKDMQQRAAQIWAGVAAALAAVYFKGESAKPGDGNDA
jgi:hypothetical protein